MTSNSGPPPPRFLPLLIALFAGSGCAALVYEIVWFQLLQLVIGSSAVSLAVLLGTFMGGMALGSIGFSRVVAPIRHPLRVYACLELGIGAAGVAVLFAMPAVSRVYLALLGHGMPGILLRAAVGVICLLPPTILMGATLPAIARWVRASPQGVSWLGFFYGGNTVGAVAGCLLAGFYLLRVHDVAAATLVAFTLNLTVALVALHLSRSARFTPVAPAAPTVGAKLDRASDPSEAPVLLVTALSGFCALASEVVWTRVLSLFLGATVYTFSIILAVFLAGLALGSSAGATLARRMLHPRIALGCCQGLQALTVAWAAYAMAISLPHWPAVTATGTWARFGFDLARCAWAILPAAILWGASFPLALAALAVPGHDPARMVGRAYAANTVGAIAGALIASLALIPMFGSRTTHQILISVSAIGAVFVLPRRPVALLPLAVAVCAASIVPPLPWQVMAYGRLLNSSHFGALPLYTGEGMNASVAVTETVDGTRFFHVSGKTEASSLPKDMRLQRMLGHLPALLHPRPRSALIVGCGAGVTAGSFVLHPSIERIVICDIEPLIPRAVARYFREENYDVVNDRRVEIVYDDARHYIATTTEKFDIITSDPIHPWVKGSAVLYSQEYFELCRQRLNPGGLVTQWVPLYESDRAVVQTELATFFSVFPQGTVWANDDEGYGYDMVVLGQREPLQVDVLALQLRLNRPDHVGVNRSLAEVELGSALDLLSTYAGRRVDLAPWLASAEINYDRNLRLQYLAGLQLESDAGFGAYRDILRRRHFPADLFRAPDGLLKQLRERQDAPRPSL